jgi:hypothetical protein
MEDVSMITGRFDSDNETEGKLRLDIGLGTTGTLGVGIDRVSETEDSNAGSIR